MSELECQKKNPTLLDAIILTGYLDNSIKKINTQSSYNNNSSILIIPEVFD